MKKPNLKELSKKQELKDEISMRMTADPSGTVYVCCDDLIESMQMLSRHVLAQGNPELSYSLFAIASNYHEQFMQSVIEQQELIAKG